MKKIIIKYFFNLLIAIDETGNAAAAGDPQETISSRLGKLLLYYGGNIPWSHPISKILACILNKLINGHCVNSIEKNVGDDGIIPDPEYKKNENNRRSDTR
jgi:hypothetical protein